MASATVLTRLPDWSPRLFAFIESRRILPHAYGSNDCCLFCADAILEMTGEDLAAGIRGTYSDQAGAEAILEAHGGLEAFVISILGEPKGPLCARQGDVALIHTRHGDAVGICEGNHVAVPGDVEQILIPLSQALKSWQVG